MTGFSKLERNRLEKLEKLREQGLEPFPHRSRRTHTSAEAIRAFEAADADEHVTAVVAGRLRSIRPMGKIAFAHFEDGEGSLQLFFRSNDIGEDQVDFFVKEFDLGDFIEAEGEMFRTRTGEITLRVHAFRMLAKAITPLPAAKDEVVDGEIVRHATLSDAETRYRQRYADLAVNPEIREIFRIRAEIVRALQNFLDSRGFLEVETPVLQPIYGGAAAQPFTTYHNQLKQHLYLRISFELYLKRLLVGGFERVYEIGRDFRNEGVDRMHNPEFTQLEFYWAYADYQDVMNMTEEMIAHVSEKVVGSLQFTFQGDEINLEPPWKRLELKESLLELAGVDLDAYPEVESLRREMESRGMQPDSRATRGKLIEKLLSEYVEPLLIQPTFVYNYPRDISPLAKSLPGRSSEVERFEGFVGGFELCNAFTELNDPLEQEARFLEMGRDYEADSEERHPMDEDYLRAMHYGMPPNGGFGMGVDRLTMLLTDTPNIREVILFPHLRDREQGG